VNVMEYRTADHLDENAAHDNDNEHICADMCELVVPRKRQLQRNTKALVQDQRYVVNMV